MTINPPKPPRVTLRDEKLYVEGETEPYFRNRSGILLRVNALTIDRRYYDATSTPLSGLDEIVRSLPDRLDYLDLIKNGVITDRLPGSESLTGKATFEFERYATFGVVGQDKRDAGPIRVSLHPALPETYWAALIFLLDGGDFYIDGYVPRQNFDDLLAAVRRGHVDSIRILMHTTMWSRGSRSTWCLAPEPDRDDAARAAPEHGYISSLAWAEKFGSHEEAKAEATEPKPHLVELPSRVYSMLTALLVIGAALLVLTFLRHQR